jgi:DNA-binding transcriptional regulator YhcF (GntR family)
MSLKSFLKKVVPEYRLLSTGIKIIAGGIGLDPKDREKVNAVADKFEKAATSIEKSITKLSETSLSKSEVEALVKAMVKPEALK